MSQNFPLWLVLVVHHFVPQARPQYPDWLGGDWAMESIDVTKEPIDDPNDWANYIFTLGEEYDEYPDQISTEKGFVPPDESELINDPPEWYPLAPNEEPYLAVLYRKDNGPSASYKQLFQGEPDPGKSHITPGTACGGALLTPRRVLTSCGCLHSLVIKVQEIRSPVKKGTLAYDIFDDVEQKLPTIYVTNVMADFKPDFSRAVENDKKNWTTNNKLNCRQLLVDMVGLHSGWDEDKKAAEINTQPLVVPFSPEIRPDFFRFFSQWPPVELSIIQDPKCKQKADLISIGMKLSKPGRLEFFSSISPSVTQVQHCKRSTFVCNSSLLTTVGDQSCYCPLRIGSHTLSGGVIGWPIVQNGRLAGITASERHPTDGTVLAIVLTSSIILHIKDYITEKVLLDQNTPRPQYRARDLQERFLLYDYDISKYATNPKSKATTAVPKGLTFSTILIAWINTA